MNRKISLGISGLGLVLVGLFVAGANSQAPAAPSFANNRRNS